MATENTHSENAKSSGVSDRERCLATARQYITKDRTNSYGSAEDNFGNIAALLNALGFKRGDSQAINADDVAVMMITVKLARLANSPDHEDSWIDLAGYAACGMQVANSRLAVEPIHVEMSYDNGPQDRVDQKVVEINRQIAQAKRDLSAQVADKTRYRADCGRSAIHQAHSYERPVAKGPHGYEEVPCDGVPRMQ